MKGGPLTEARLYFYRVSGLVVSSTVPIQQMHEVETGGRQDIEINLSFTGKRIWFEPVPGVVRPYVKMFSRERVMLEHRVHGLLDITAEKINVEVEDETHWEEARTYVLGTALAISFFMRGIVPFHMSSVQLGATAFSFAGESNAGKSTWAALSILELGGVLLTDDVARVSGDQLTRRATIWPSLRRLRFREDIGSMLLGRGLRTVRDPQGRLECYDFKSSENCCDLRIVFLPVACSGQEITVVRVGPERRLAEIMSNVFRLEYGVSILGRSALMKAVLEFASCVDVMELRYPPGAGNIERNVAGFHKKLIELY